MSKGMFGVIPWWVCGVVALALTVLWAVVWPSEASGSNGFRYLVVRWGHSLVWVLLGASFFVRMGPSGVQGLAEGLAVAGGACYLAFLLATYVLR